MIKPNLKYYNMYLDKLGIETLEKEVRYQRQHDQNKARLDAALKALKTAMEGVK